MAVRAVSGLLEGWASVRFGRAGWKSKAVLWGLQNLCEAVLPVPKGSGLCRLWLWRMCPHDTGMLCSGTSGSGNGGHDAAGYRNPCIPAVWQLGGICAQLSVRRVLFHVPQLRHEQRLWKYDVAKWAAGDWKAVFWKSYQCMEPLFLAGGKEVFPGH